ncbi:hypothetical protein KI688_002746 [Linnemannia hyalina]|uniref:Uncharacterized protein n=1 Tax=Linnemannia hyalina TaxID=64524 RepID=A0A9P7XQS0_9FUNG|nr:hypothetical protein KI688_002746 [Linnemannia hyalina]
MPSDATAPPSPSSLPPPPTKIKSRTKGSRSANPAVYCCCCPVASGVWILALCLVVPSVALVLGLNIANLGGVIRINTPVQAKVFYSVIYSLYALIGLGIGLGLNRFANANRRLQVLIALYWILIATTIVEGIYFGVIIARNKAKFTTNCVDGPAVAKGSDRPATLSPVVIGLGTNGTVAVAGGEQGGKSGRGMDCHMTGVMVGVIYTAGPGGWIIVHIAWILMVVLYAKALRRHYAADEEHGSVKMAPLAAAAAGGGHGHDLDRPFSKSGLHRSLAKQQQYQLEDPNKNGTGNIEPASGFHSHQTHPFQLDNSSHRSSSGGLGAMFRNMRSWSSSSPNNSSTFQEFPSSNNISAGKNKAMHVIGEGDAHTEEGERGRSRTPHRQGRNSNTSITITIINHDTTPDSHHDSDDSSDDDDSEVNNSYNRLTRLGTSSTDNSLSSKTDIPADGKGWWIRQIEGKRRGEICPCTLDPREFDARELGPCWCGKERRISSQASQSASGLLAGSSSGSSSLTSIAPPHSQGQQQ